MIEYPYDEQKAAVDKETFAILTQHFELISDYKDKEWGRYIFLYDPERVNKLSTQDLLALSPYLFQYRTCAFNGVISPDESKVPKVKEIIALMKERGITKESFLDAMINFEFSQLGNESAQTISSIANDIDDNCEYLQSEEAGRWFYSLKDRHIINTKACTQANEGRKQPFELEKIIKLEAPPMALDYAPDARLYILDENGKVHEFEEGEKTGEWKLQKGMAPGFYKDAQEQFFSPIFPNISVKDRILYLAHGSQLVRYDLENMQSPPEKLQSSSNALALWDPELAKRSQVSPSDIWFHDVCLKDENIFVSASLRTTMRYIIQVFETGEHKILYTHNFPRGYGTNNYQDLTLRLGLLNAGLYFSENNGISRLTPSGSQEMIEQYKRVQGSALEIDPITKFTLGTDFMVAVGRVQGFEMPMLQIFKPVYENGEKTLAITAQIQPSHFERVYISDIPKKTGGMIRPLSIAAHQDKFAFTHTDFNRIFCYHLNTGPI